jgi:hypothetical protein
MKYCVIKDTIRDIAQSENVENLIESGNSTVIDGMLVEYEILTEEEYQVRKALEPTPPQEPTETEKLKAELETIQGALDFIILNY